MRNKLVFLAILSALVLGLATGAWAYTVTVMDTTLVKSYVGSNPYLYNGQYWHDVIGAVGGGSPFQPGFAVEKAEITWSGADVQIKFYTNYPAAGLVIGGTNVGVADLFLDLDENGIFESGVKMSGADQGKFYGSLDIIQYSAYYFGSGGWIYGGKYDQTNPQDPPVTFTSTANPISGTLSWTGSGPYEVVIDLPGVNSDGSWNKFGFFWGVAHCSNEAISAVVTPLPGAVWLLGAGLLGLLGWRRRQ